jgi:hypothetical protein
MKKLVIRLVGLGKKAKVSEPRYLSGDEFALSGGYEELINCKECAVEYDRTEYQSDTCSDCEDKRVAREKESK